MVASETTIQRAMGVFPKHEQAETAFKALQATGFAMEQVSLIAKPGDKSAETQVSEVEQQTVGTPTQIVADTLTASSLGAVLVGLTSLSLLGIGPILAAGSLGVALVTSIAGLGAGAIAAQQLVQALQNLGMSEAQARLYSDRLQRGDHLVLVEGTPEQIQQAQAIFEAEGVEAWGVYSAPTET